MEGWGRLGEGGGGCGLGWLKETEERCWICLDLAGGGAIGKTDVDGGVLPILVSIVHIKEVVVRQLQNPCL